MPNTATYTPRNGPCAPWIQASDVLDCTTIKQAIAAVNAQPGVTAPTNEQLNAWAASCATSATEVLYQLSGKQFTGLCGPVEIRPVSRPNEGAGRGWVAMWQYGGFGSFGSFQPAGAPASTSIYGYNGLPVIKIRDYPVREIVQVKIDGVVIPPDEYDLREGQYLVRMRTSSTAEPTERWGWPTSQIQDLPDSEPGTFSIIYKFGMDPGEAGKNACIDLAAFLMQPKLGNPTNLPQRVTHIQRAGVTADIVSPIDMIAKGATGITTVDLWLLSVNPSKVRRNARSFSPDRPTQRRTGLPSTTN